MSQWQEGSPLLPKARETFKSRVQITLMVLNIALSSFYFGYTMVYFGQLDINTMLNVLAFDIDPNVAKGLLNGSVTIGGLLGALSSSVLINKLSRRQCLLAVNFGAMIVGALIYIENFYSLLFFRLCQGIFVGIYSSLASLIIKELSPTEISGTLGSYTQLNVCFGVFFGCIFSYILKKITGDDTGADFWYILYGFTQITLVIQTVVLLFVFPFETPKYLLSTGREEQARKLIQVIYKEEYVDQILRQKKADLEASNRKVKETDEQSSLRGSAIPIIVAIHLAALQQFSGVNAIIVYGGDIASSATTGELSALMPSLINLEQVIGTFATGILLVKFGRKTILQVGTLLQGVSCLLVGIGFFLKSGSEDSAIGEALVLVGLFLFMGIFGVSLGPIVWLYIPEIVQPEIVPFTTATNWICASLMVILFPILTDNVLDSNPAVLFVFFTAWLLVSVVVNMKFVIESKDKSQKLIQEEYSALKMC